MLLQRVSWPGFRHTANRLSAREALEIATLGGAKVLGRYDIGSLEPGKAADFVAFRTDDLVHAGAQSDPVAALITCAPVQCWLSVINGKLIVEEGEICTIDLPKTIEQHNRLSQMLLEQAGI
jgi:8-oxoguanine deaminase